MGYTTEFEGRFDLDRALTPEQAAYLARFAETRRMCRRESVCATMPDPARLAVGLEIGTEGAYFTGGLGFAGQDHDDSILDHNMPPAGQPGLWCHWVPTPDRLGLEWDEGEKFYDYTAWLRYVIEHFLTPWRLLLSGRVTWQGEESDDFGTIEVVKNDVIELPGER